jgi:hypothetical protein
MMNQLKTVSMDLTAFAQRSPVEFAILLFVVFLLLSFAGSKVKWLSDNLEYVLMAVGLYAVISLSGYPGMPQLNEGLATIALGLVIIRMTRFNPINALQKNIQYGLMALFAVAFVHTLLFKMLFRSIIPADFLLTTFTLYDILPLAVVAVGTVMVGTWTFSPEVMQSEKTTFAPEEVNAVLSQPEDPRKPEDIPVEELPQSQIETKPSGRVIPIEGTVNIPKAPIRPAPQSSQVIAEANAGRRLTFIARTPDGKWLRVDNRRGGVAWIEAQHVTVEGDISVLYIVTKV